MHRTAVSGGRRGAWLRRAATLLFAATLLGAPGCGGGGGGGGGGGSGGGDGSVAGRVVFDDGSGAFAARRATGGVEDRPDHALDLAADLGVLRPGQGASSAGTLTAGDAADPLDACALRLAARAHVVVRVETTDGDLDPDLAVYDPQALRLVRTAQADGPSEAMTLDVRGPLHLLVTAARGAGAYRLVVETSPTEAVTAQGGGEPTPAGELVPGDAVRLVGTATPTAPTTSFLVTLPARAAVACVAGSDRTTVTLHDVTAGPAAATWLGGPAPAVARDLDTAVLRVDVTAPVGPFSVRVEATEPTAPVGLVPPRAAPLALEEGVLRGVPAGYRYGRPVHPLAPGKVLVRTTDGGDGAAGAALAARGLVAVEEVAPATTLWRAPTDGLEPEDAARVTWARVAAARAVAGVAYADPSYRRFARKTPDDPRYGEQWHYSTIRAPEAWDVTTGSASVVVAVVDTGWTDHPDLVGKDRDGYDFVSDAANAADGGGRDADPTDPGDGVGGEPSSFHGTHVAGTIGAATDNGKGVAGVCWAVTIMPLRVLGVEGGDDADIIAAIRYAAGLSNASGRTPSQRANVINMSLGGGGYDQAFQDAITAARDAGVVIFAAAGNSGTRAEEYPASFDGVVSVAAVDRQERRTSYSNRNASVDLAAPGGDSSRTEADGVLSTVYDDASGTAKATYAFYDGTSMATPHAAGVAALVLSVAPTLSPAQVEQVLFDSAKDLGTAGRDDDYGHGLVDAKAAVDLASSGTTGGPRLSLSPTSLSFVEGGATSQDVTVRNGGSGRVVVASATARTDDGAGWLAASLRGTGDATRSVDAVRVTVDASRLADGTYRGSVAVASDAGSGTVAVTLRVGTGGGAATRSDVWVLAVDADTDETVADVRVSADGDGRFSLDALPAGSYWLVAGSDDDDDGYVGGAGEWYGEYEDLVVVDGRSRVGSVQIVVTLDATGAATAVRRRVAR